MNEPTKTLLGDLALAGGTAIVVGSMVACALVPLLVWWRDRKIDRGGRAGRGAPTVVPSPVVGGDGGPFAAVTPTEELAPSLHLDDEIAQTARRVIKEIAG